MQKNKDLNRAVPIRIMEGIIGGALLAILVCVFVLFGASVGISSGMVGEGMEYQLTLFACAVSTAIGGFFAVRRYRGFLVGIGTGIVYYLCLLTIGVLLYDVKPLEQGGLGILLASLVGGALPGLLGKNRRGKRKH